jgi:hypothetical protein
MIGPVVYIPEEGRGRAVVCNQHIELAVVVEVAYRQPSRSERFRKYGSCFGAYVAELAAFASKQQQRFLVLYLE